MRDGRADTSARRAKARGRSVKGTYTTRWGAGRRRSIARSSASPSMPTHATTTGCCKAARPSSRMCWSLRRASTSTTGRPAGSPRAARAAARSAAEGGASTPSQSMPLGTTRSRAPGCRRRRSTRATAGLTAMVRSAESATAISSGGSVRGMVWRVATNARGSRRRHRSQVSARRSRVALLFATSTASRTITASSAVARGPSRRKSSGTTSSPASRARPASMVPGRQPISTRCPRRASCRLRFAIATVEPEPPP